jgi:hypothetical protein
MKQKNLLRIKNEEQRSGGSKDQCQQVSGLQAAADRDETRRGKTT